MKAACWLLCACALTAQTVTVTGIVTNAITHEPIQAVSVLLYLNGSPSGANTDASGGFRIAKVKPGTYRLFPSRSGFEGAATEIRIEAGADPPPLDLTMVPWPAVKGTVFDPQRHPVPKVRVRANNPGNAPGVVYEAVTDAAGHYSLVSLSPGQYHFLALPPSTGDAAGPVELAPTWFPSASDSREAPPLTLAPGNELSGCDIVLRAVPVFRLSGKVLDERGQAAAGATLESTLAARKATVREDGTFDLPRVRSGDGVLRADWQRGEVKLRGFAKVAVGRYDLENVTVRLAPPVSVSGELELDGQAGHPCEGEAILTPVDGQGETAQAEFGESRIRFERVFPGRYRLTILPGWASGRHYLDSVRLGDRDITLDELEIAPGMTPFRVVLRTGGGRLRGTVDNGKGGLVVLTPRDQRLRVRPFIVVSTFLGSTFAIDNVRPGDYYVFTSQGSFNADEMQNPIYAQPYLDNAATVRVERGATATVTLGYVRAAPLQ